jgi:D-alanine-D-alanine ligase
MSNFKKVCVLSGGVSNEREVSLDSGRNVAEALSGLGTYDVVPVVLDRESVDGIPACDACFLALHGGWGESGGIQSALDAKGIPYTGPGAAASRLAMDKIATKQALEKSGVPTPDWVVATAGNLDSVLPPSGFPCVVKAPRDGSSVGVYLAKDETEFRRAIGDAIAIDGREALIEKFIDGREMTVAVLCGEPLPAVEIRARGGWYGYEEKYRSDETEYAFPSDGFIGDLQRMAVKAYETCGCRGAVRVDFRIGGDGSAYVLELNTLPGMTSHSLVPKAAAKAGIPFPELCGRIIENATFDRIGQ